MRFTVLTALFVVVSTVYASPAHIQARNDPTKTDSAILKRWPSPVEQSTSAVQLLKRIAGSVFRYGRWCGMTLDKAWVEYGRLVEYTGKDSEQIRKLPDVYILRVPGVNVRASRASQGAVLNAMRKKHRQNIEILYYTYTLGRNKRNIQTAYFSVILKDDPEDEDEKVVNWPPTVIEKLREDGLAKRGSDDKQWPSPIEQSTSTVQLLKRDGMNSRYSYGPWGLMRLPQAWQNYGKSLTGDENMRKLPGVYLLKMTGVARFEDLSREKVLSDMSKKHKDKEFLDYLYLKQDDHHAAYFSFLLKDVPGRWDYIDIKNMKSAFGDL